MNQPQNHHTNASALTDALGLATPPIAITFAASAPTAVTPYGGTHPEPTADGRTGAVPAGCVFWMKATERTFSTVAADHGNCSVGSMTHGFKTMAEVAGNADVAALLASGWVTMAMVPQIPVVEERPEAVVYGPLAAATTAPDVVLLRINGKQAMVLSDALPEVRFEGKPQCHIVAMAKQHGQVAISVGCMLSRVRTGMKSTEMTCAIPGARVGEVLAALARAAAADRAVAAYAAEDAKRF